MPTDDYQKMREIYMGSFGHTYLVQRSIDKKMMAMREFDFAGMDQTSRLGALRDVQLLTSLKHPYIIRYSEKFFHETSLCMVFEEVEEGTMFNFVRMCSRQRALMPESTALRWFTQICLAVKYLHERAHPIVHRDITTQTIYLVKKETTEVKLLVEFGAMEALDTPDSLVHGQVGSHFCQAPEICCREPYGTAADMWALGCVLYEMCSAHMSWDIESIPFHIENIMIAPMSHLSEHYSRDLARVAAALLTHEADERPTADLLLKMPLLQEEIRQMLHARHRSGAKAQNQQRHVKRSETPVDEVVSKRPDVNARDAPFSARNREGTQGLRFSEDAYSGRATCGSMTARAREGACSARAREDSYSARARDSSLGGRMNEDSYSARARESSLGARKYEDTSNARADGEMSGARTREGSRGVHAREEMRSARGRDELSSVAKSREDSYSARGVASRPLGENNPRMPHTARSASPCEAAKMLLMSSAARAPSPSPNIRASPREPSPYHEAAAKLLLEHERVPTPAYDPTASRHGGGDFLLNAKHEFEKKEGRRPRRSSSFRANAENIRE